MNEIEINMLYAVAGSILAECAIVYSYFVRGKALPARYKDTRYYVVRGIIVLGAGILPGVFGVQSHFESFSMGAAAPLILSNLSQGDRLSP